MQYVKIETGDGETRWINLERVSRVTLATEAPRGEPLLVVTFADANPEGRLQIRGSDEASLKAIRQLTKALDKLARPKR